MLVTIEDIKKIRPGCKHTFKCDSPRGISVVRTQCTYLRRSYPELGMRYKTKADYEQTEITVEAIAVVEPKSKKGQKV